MCDGVATLSCSTAMRSTGASSDPADIVALDHVGDVDQPGEACDSARGGRCLSHKPQIGPPGHGARNRLRQLACRVRLVVLLDGESDQLGHLRCMNEHLGECGPARGAPARGDPVTFGGGDGGTLEDQRVGDGVGRREGIDVGPTIGTTTPT